MSAENLILTIGWALLILSWIVPMLVKDKRTGSFIGVLLSGVSVGLFIAHTIILHFKN